MSARLSIGLALVVLTVPHSAFGQFRDGFGPPDAAQTREAAEDARELLGVSDEQWKAIQPRLDKVQDCRRNAFISRGMFRYGGPSGFFGVDGEPLTPLQQANVELRAALDGLNPKTSEIKAKLKALREVREKARARLAAAEEELRALLDTRQEAVLVALGLLD